MRHVVDRHAEREHQAELSIAIHEVHERGPGSFRGFLVRWAPRDKIVTMAGRGARRSRESKARREIPATVERYILAQRPQHRPLLRLLRKLIKDALSGAGEELMWGQPCYLVGREKVAYLQTAGDHMSLGFFRGAKLDDPKGLVEVTGEDMRHVKVRVPGDIKRREFARLLRQAARVAIEKT